MANSGSRKHILGILWCNYSLSLNPSGSKSLSLWYRILAVSGIFALFLTEIGRQEKELSLFFSEKAVKGGRQSRDGNGKLQKTRGGGVVVDHAKGKVTIQFVGMNPSGSLSLSLSESSPFSSRQYRIARNFSKGDSFSNSAVFSFILNNFDCDPDFDYSSQPRR